MQQQKPILLFDVDRTLFDTDKFTAITSQHFSTYLGTNREELAKHKKTYMDTLPSTVDFNPEEYITHIAKKYGVPAGPLRTIFLETPDHYQQSIFDESIHVLQHMKDTHRLGIYSEGHSLFQHLKITHNGIIEHVEKELTFIVPHKVMPEIKDRIPPRAIIVDDKITIVEALATWGHVKPIWINRKSGEEHKTIPTIHSLRELPQKLRDL